MISLLFRKNTLKVKFKTLLVGFLCLFGLAIHMYYISAQEQPAPTTAETSLPDQEKPLEKPAPQLKLDLSIRDGICRNSSPIMMDLLFRNDSNQTQKLCVYMFYDSLLKLELKNSAGKEVDFQPKLIKAGTISKDDWVEILPGRVYKKSFSLARKVIDSTGYKLKPDNYTVRAIYEGCSKFDSTLPDLKIESNRLYLMVTE